MKNRVKVYLPALVIAVALAYGLVATKPSASTQPVAKTSTYEAPVVIVDPAELPQAVEPAETVSTPAVQPAAEPEAPADDQSTEPAEPAVPVQTQQTITVTQSPIQQFVMGGAN